MQKQELTCLSHFVCRTGGDFTVFFEFNGIIYDEVFNATLGYDTNTRTYSFPDPPAGVFNKHISFVDFYQSQDDKNPIMVIRAANFKGAWQELASLQL